MTELSDAAVENEELIVITEVASVQVRTFLNSYQQISEFVRLMKLIKWQGTLQLLILDRKYELPTLPTLDRLFKREKES
jgi:hypothetical protein